MCKEARRQFRIILHSEQIDYMAGSVRTKIPVIFKDPNLLLGRGLMYQLWTWTWTRDHREGTMRRIRNTIIVWVNAMILDAFPIRVVNQRELWGLIDQNMS